MISDELNLFGHLLDYQRTKEFKEELSERREKLAVARRPASALASKKYRQQHPDLVKLREEARQHKELLFSKQIGLCHWCGIRLRKTYEVDHIKPLIKGGKNNLSNLCVCHIKCNRQKSSKTDWKPRYNKKIA